MESTSQTRFAAWSGAVLLTVAVLLLVAATAQAAAPLTQLQRAHAGADVTYAAAPLSQLQRAHGSAAVTYAAAGPLGSTLRAGRGGVFPRAIARTTPVGESLGQIIGGITVVALVIALVALLVLGSRGSRRGQLAPVTSLVQAPSASPAAQHDDRERKAA